ncbi:hypothetical protein Q1695_008890 [Nippostrongylus brasiliensis]|nr:hypothetical protein Q1695_008890 [Nippostrongylus brasiliensis]
MTSRLTSTMFIIWSKRMVKVVTLLPSQVPVTDVGSYSCKAINEYGEARSEATVHISKETAAPQFAEALRPISVKETETFSLSVNVTGEPAPKVSWFKDDVAIDIDNVHYLVKEDGQGSYTLTVTSSTVTDIGSYSCKAINEFGEARTETSVYVQSEALAPSFTKSLTDQSISLGDQLILFCSVKGVPQPTVEFFHESVRLKSSSRISVEHDKANTHWRLLIKEANAEDLGKYHASAKNVAGTAISEATVSEKSVAPVFEQGLKRTSVKEKEEIRMEVKVTGTQPEVTWFKDNQPIQQDSVHEIIQDVSTKTYTLVVKEAHRYDAGMYSVKAANAAGSVESTAEVDVTEVLEKPSFVKELVSTEVKINETVKLEVTVKGTPAPEVTWKKEGQPVNIDNTHIISKSDQATGTFSITIASATLEDVGKYTCEATNVAGTAECSANFAVIKDIEAPVFTEKLQPMDVKETESVMLSVTVTGTPTPSVQWFKDDVPVQIDNVHLIAKEEGSGHYVLSIKEARTTDQGSYSCKATNEAGEAKTEATVHVAKESLAPQFTETLRPLEVKETETATLSVTVTGSPEPKITWLKDSVPIQIDDVHFLSKDEGSGHFTLTIKDCKVSDIGSYSCKATNVAGEAKTEANMGVVEELESPHFTDVLKPLEVDEGKLAELHCTVVGKPEPEITWLKNGLPIQIDERHIIKKEEEGKHTLVIKDMRAEDVGSYTCQAVNKAGKDETAAEIKVPKYGFEKQKIEEVQPIFIEPLQEAVATEGETVILECRVNEESKPEIRWFKDDKPVEPGPHFVVETTESGKIKLTIHHATKEDIGSYRCEAINKAGKAETQAKLQYAESKQETVTDESEQLREMVAETMTTAAAVETKVGRGPPEFVELLRSCTVTEKQQAVLKCKVKGEPTPKIKWTKDGKEVEMTARVKCDFKDDGTLTLTVEEATQSDAGEYRCYAENELGSAWTEGPIVVTLIGAPVPDGEAPDFIQPVRPVMVNEGETAVLEGKVSGKPKPTVKWYKNGEEIKPSDHFVVESLDDGTQRLTVKSTTMDDLDEYRCSASNEFGDVWSDVTLTVKRKPQEAPSFTKTLVEVSVVEGESATYECKVTGTPEPEIKWFKDKEEISSTDEHFVQTKESDGTARLVIKSTKVKDSGEIRCEATNPAGKARTDAPLTVTLPDEEVAPEFAQDLQACSVNEGELAKFECKVKGTHLAVKWFKDGQELKPGDGIQIESLPDGTNRLTIDKTKMADQGNYRVEATNPAGSMSSKAPLSIQAPETLKIKRPLEDVTVDKGTKILLSVEVEGQPKTIKWYKGSEQVTTTRTTKIEKVSDVVYKLEVENCEMTDAGAYRVVLSTESESVESSCTVTVKDTTTKVQLPSFKKGLNDQAVPKGQSLVLEVEIEGKPKVVKWYKNGDELKDVKAEDMGDGKYRLTIPDFKDSDVGEYSVTAENECGEVESKAKVTLQEPTDDGKTGKPEIVSGLVPTTVKCGETAVFTVKVKGPVKAVKWYKNGKEIPDAKTKDNGDGSYELLIPDAKKDDTADYKVVLSNDAGDADSSAALTVKLPQIEIVKGLQDTTVPQKETGVLEIETNQKPKQVKWYKNGKEITPSDKPQAKQIDDNKYQLVIPDAGKDDTAEYKVVLTDDDGNEAESSCALTVKLPSGIEIVKGLEDATVPKGQQAVLEVETSKAPKQVKWYKNGKEITPSDKPEVKKVSDTKHQLVIPDVAGEDTADYKVVLTDDDDNSADSFCALTVRLPDKEPKIIKGLDDRTLAAGLPTIWEVETEGSPRTVKWYKNGKELTGATAAQMKISKIDDNHYVLEIPKCVVDDTGDYKIEVENDAGKANSTGKLTVEPQLTFLKPLKDQEITEGENAEFQVETNAKPRVVKWYKNGQEITPDSRFVVTEDETKFKLVIKNATRDDAADYKIVLSNTAGDADSSAKLTVKRAKPGVPKIIKGLEDQVVAKGASLVFEVKVEGEVDELRWSKDAAPITAGANAIIEKIDDKTYRLTIPKADLDDAGHYSVEAINETGKAASDAKGEVDEKPEIVKGLNDLEVSEGDDEVFKVEVSVPVRTVKWYKNGQEIKPSVHLEPKKIGPKKYELIINRAELDDAATFKVVLSNAAGECDSSAQLTVTKPNILKMLEGLKDIDVDEGQPLELKVKVEGIPKVVKWYKNGQELAPTDAELKENPETGEYSLLIPQSKKSDGGAYRVTLANDKGEIYSGAVAHVKTVKPKDTGIAANFLSPLEDTEVAEGETLTLKCVVAGEPFPSIVWTKDGVELEKDERVVMRVALDGTATLRIRDARKSDFGQYRITATNEAGSETSSCQVTVKDKGEQPSKPRFIIPLKSCEAEIGENKMFEVKIRGFPKPTLQWLLNEKPIQFDERVTVEDMGAGNYCLTIKDVRDSDFGTLRCIATNDLGKDECQAEFDCSGPRAGREKDDDRYPPRFNVPLWDRRIPINDPLSIECHVDAKPTAEIEWFKDGKKLEASESIEIRNSSDGACRVRIAKFGKEDVGVYMCVAKNPLGVADTRSNYSVEVVEMEEVVEKKEYAPRFNPGLEDKSVNVGQSVRLTCTVDAIPKASIVWYKDGLPLRSGGRHNIIIAEDGTCTLDITETVEGDEGAYRCVASNEHGSINTSCMVTVKVPKAEAKKEGEEPFFTKGLVDVWTDRGETFTLKCCVKGDPFPEIKWFRNGILVRDTVRTTIETSTDGTCSLTVKECTMSDEGIYRCEAENKHGKAKTQATAHIQVSLGKGDVPKLEMGSAPKFVIPLEDQTVTVGSTIDLECKVTGEPMPQVKWSKDGGPIWEDSRYEWDIDEAKGVYHLRITSATVNDEGTYRAVATNESGSATTKSFTRIDDGLLSAQLPQKSTPPRFTIKLGDARAVEGQPLRFECKVEGSPLPELTWHKDGAQIHPSDRVQISMEPDGSARLVIPQCCMDDEGIYRVIATNPSGSAHDKGNAIVKKAPRDFDRRSADRDQFDANKVPKVVEPLENVKIPEKQGFRLRCKFSGEPKLAIKWFKDGERVFPYGRLQLLESPDGVCELIVDSSIRQDAGGYRCVAENAFGSARTTCDVTVIQKEKKPVTDFDATLKEGKAPGFTVPLTIRRAKPGDDVAFECVPYGNPFPQIKWLKDGIEITPSDKIRFESLPDGTQRLHLSSVDFFSEGYFRCVATNEHGTASTKAELCIDGTCCYRLSGRKTHLCSAAVQHRIGDLSTVLWSQGFTLHLKFAPN